MKHYAIEAVRKQSSELSRTEVHSVVLAAIEQSKLSTLPIQPDEGYPLPVGDLEQISPGICDSVDSITVYIESHHEVGPTKNGIEVDPSSQFDPMGLRGDENDVEMINEKEAQDEVFSVFVFELGVDGEESEYIDENDLEEGQSAASHHWLLPSRSFHGLWDSLIFHVDIKCKLVDYVKTAVLFSTKGVNQSLVSWNKVVLLHGPPGTGKTSLCKALAQKAVIRLQDEFLYGQLIEINSHSLFSKWFSESGKLVTKMFDKILELVEDPKGLVFLLIDEVESLAQCRQSAEAGNEPTDSIRAVNALLTQIDRIKKYPNVLILTTSNIVGSIDVAFVDRADLKLHIDYPSSSVIYGILASCINELLRVRLITTKSEVEYVLPVSLPTTNRTFDVETLLQIAERAKGFSGRALRKLPFLTYSNYFSSMFATNCHLTDFLNALSKAVDKELTDRSILERGSRGTSVTASTT